MIIVCYDTVENEKSIPIILYKSTNKSANVGDSVSFECRPSYPNMTEISWYYHPTTPSTESVDNVVTKYSKSVSGYLYFSFRFLKTS